MVKFFEKRTEMIESRGIGITITGTDKEELKGLGVTKISNSGIKSIGRIEINL